MKIVIRALLVLTLAVSALADQYHPQILKSQVVSLDAAAIERDANSGTPFELTLGDTQLKVVLNPAPVWPKEGLKVLEVEKDGSVKERVVEGNITYAGDVLDEDPETSELRFTISGGVIEGYVLSKTGWWFIEPLTRFDPKASADQYLVYATRDLDIALLFDDDGVEADTVYDDRGPSPDGIPVVMVGDKEYVNASDVVPFETRQATLVNMVNGIYWGQTYRQFTIAAIIADFGGTFLTSTDAGVLLNKQLKPFVNFAGGVPGADPSGLPGLNSLHSYLAHLTSGKNLDGNTVGKANQNGRFSLTQQATPVDDVSPVNAQGIMIAAHELGHNFSGTHEAADCVCPNGGTACNPCHHTIMAAVYEDDNVPVFSDGTNNPLRNNRQSIRDFMAMQGF